MQDKKFPLSQGQQALWTIYQQDRESFAYNHGILLEFESKLDKVLLLDTLFECISFNPMLRTEIHEVNGEVYQSIVQPELYLTWNNNILDTAQSDLKNPFKLECNSIHFYIYQSEDKTRLLVAQHHIMGDAKSLAIIAQSIVNTYGAKAGKKSTNSSKENSHYIDYINWEKSLLVGKKEPRMRKYWTKLLAGNVPILQLPTDFPRPTIQTFNGNSSNFHLADKLTKQLNELAKQHKVTLSAILLSAWQVLLQRYSGQKDIWCGIPTSVPRSQPDFSNLVGYMISPMIIKAEFPDQHDISFKQLMQKNNRQIFLGLYHQPYPFTHLIEQLQPKYNASYPALIQTMFSMELANLIPKIFEGNNCLARKIDIDQMEGQLDLSLTISEDENFLKGSLQYNSDLFIKSTVRQMAIHLEIILRGMVDNIDQRINSLPLLTAEDKQKLIQWNAHTYKNILKKQTINKLFEQQVVATPQNIALIFSDEKITYQQLNEKANAVSHYLQTIGTHSDDIILRKKPYIAIIVERSIDMIIGLLAILKMGGIYVPIDPSYPKERILYILKDCKAPLLLTQTHLLTQIEQLEYNATIICLDNISVTKKILENPSINGQANDTAYVIYTSGSTGMPKGVCTPHYAVSRLVKNTDYIEFSADHTFLQLAPLAFDASTLEIWGSILNGSTLVIMPPQQPSLTEIGHALKQYKITTLWLTAGLFHLIVNERLDDLQHLKQLITGGDVISLTATKKVLKKLTTCRLFNGYGPTENTTFTTVCYLNNMSLTNSVSIGKPINNTQVYILDTEYQLVPPGVIGELCTGGEGLAHGYLNQIELTANKFIEIKLFGITTRIYKTGDLARWLPDGNLEFIGRIDNQIKLRGFRIELGEIETVLSQYPQVTDVIVTLFKKDNDKQLVAYLVISEEVKEDKDIFIQKLQIWIKTQLPEYSIPASYIILDVLPLTANSKVDRKALPDPIFKSSSKAQAITPTEELLATLWKNILKCENIGRDDNFFELGGHSLLATQLVAHIRTHFQVELPIRTVFEYPQLSTLATAIKTASNTISLPPITVQAEDMPKQLSFAQQRLWFLNQFEEDNWATYNIPLNLQLSGSLNLSALQKSLSYIIEYHTSLHQCFPKQNGQAQCQPLNTNNIDALHTHDLRDLSDKVLCDEIKKQSYQHAITPFDLTQGPLFQADVLLINKSKSILLLNMHHIISDGWSMGVFIRDWQKAYDAFSKGYTPNLPILTIQYSDYSIWQKDWLQGDILQQQIDYWHKQLLDSPELLTLPTDKPRPPQESYQGAFYMHELSAVLSQSLTTLSHQQGVTLFMTLLSAFNILLSRYSRQEDICVGSPIANRTHQQTEDLMGFFVNTLVLRTQLDPSQSFDELLQTTRQCCLDAYAYQDIPFEILVEKLQPKRSLSHHPLFQVMFVLQNNPDIDLNLTDLSIELQEPDYPIAKFDLTLNMEERQGKLHCGWEYATDLFEEDTILRMSKNFETLLTAIVDNPKQLISQLPLLHPNDIKKLQQWNNTHTHNSEYKTIVNAFEQQVTKTPHNIALVYEEQQWTYQQLNRKSNQIADYLIKVKVENNITTNCLVAIVLERSLEMFIGLLATLKVGSAYVPIDPNYPSAHLHYMLENSAAPLLLTHTSLRSSLSLNELAHNCTVVYLDLINIE